MKKKTIFLILLFGFLIRLIALNQSLWLDEAITANVVSHYSYSEIITKFSPTDFHPPLFYLVEKFWTNIFSYSEIALRFPSIIFSLLTGWVIYLIGKGLKSERVGLWAAALFLFNPLIIYYSQEARPYMLVTLFMTLIIYYLLKIAGPVESFLPASARHGNHDLRAVGNPSSLATHQIILFNLFIFLSFLTFYGSIFFIFAIYLWLLFKKQYKVFLMALPGFLLAGVLIFPLFIQQYANSKIVLSSVKNWDLVLGKANIKNLLLIPIKFSIGRISFEPKIIYWFVAGLWTTFLFSFILRPKSNLRGYFMWLFFVPLAIAFIASFFTPILQYFRFIYLIPLLSLLISISVKNSIAKTVSLSGFVVFSLIYLLNPAYHREDWKSLVKDLKVKDVYMIASSSDPIRYYNKNVNVNDLRSIENIQEKEITIIPYTSEIHGIKYAEILNKIGYVLESEKSYRELKTEYWKLKN